VARLPGDPRRGARGSLLGPAGPRSRRHVVSDGSLGSARPAPDPRRRRRTAGRPQDGGSPPILHSRSGPAGAPGPQPVPAPRVPLTGASDVLGHERRTARPVPLARGSGRAVRLVDLRGLEPLTPWWSPGRSTTFVGGSVPRVKSNHLPDHRLVYRSRLDVPSHPSEPSVRLSSPLGLSEVPSLCRRSRYLTCSADPIGAAQRASALSPGQVIWAEPVTGHRVNER
jgi:hypothetical protein